MEIRLDVTTTADAVRIEQRYAGVAKYLGEEIGATLTLVVSNSPSVRDHPLNSILIAPPILIRKSMDYSYTPVAQGGNKDRVLFVARTHSRSARLRQYRGTRLAMPTQGSQAEFMARRTLNQAAIRAEQFFGSIRYGTAKESPISALIAGIVDVAAVSERMLPPGDTEIARLATTPLFPTFGISMRNRQGNAAFERMRKALFLPSEEGRKQLETTGIMPLDAMDNTFFSVAT